MIQIQDDNFNQSTLGGQTNSTTPTNSTMPTNLTTPTNLTSQVNSSPITPKQDNKQSEIDNLLAEIERLSKNLEQKRGGNENETDSKKDFAPNNLLPNASQPVGQVSSQSVSSAASNTSADEKFDFDAFLHDLENKIDQVKANESTTEAAHTTSPVNSNQSSNNLTSAANGVEETDFRKARLASDLNSADSNHNVAEPIATPEQTNQQQTENSEDLKAQNIFEMLGLMSISDAEKNQFLDELEEVIWDDFVAHDLELLLTSEEFAEARKILDNSAKSEMQRKEDLIDYLDKLLPNLDELLYDKALELKSEMMGERLSKMKADADPMLLAKIKEAESLISQIRWHSAILLLNQQS